MTNKMFNNLGVPQIPIKSGRGGQFVPKLFAATWFSVERQKGFPLLPASRQAHP
jgi:hypothetical protein